MAVYRKAPKCPKCGESYGAIHWEPEVFFCGDTFIRWDREGHVCRLGIRYFIERMDTRQWFWTNGDKRINERTSGWTDAPGKAKMFVTKDEAEEYLKNSWIPPRIECQVTEHEFV